MSRLREAIASAGLPDRYEPLLLTFRLADAFQRGEYLIIGDDEGTDLCVQPSDGTVYSVDPAGYLRTRFMNTDVRKLALCIALYERYRAGLEGLESEKEGRAAVAGLRREIATVDPAALEDPESWWSVILEQAEDGLL